MNSPQEPHDLDPRLTAWLLGELSPDAAAEVAAKVAGDPALQAFCDEQRRVVDLLEEALQSDVGLAADPPPFRVPEAAPPEAFAPGKPHRKKAGGNPVIRWMQTPHPQLRRAAVVLLFTGVILVTLVGVMTPALRGVLRQESWSPASAPADKEIKMEKSKRLFREKNGKLNALSEQEAVETYKRETPDIDRIGAMDSPDEATHYFAYDEAAAGMDVGGSFGFAEREGGDAFSGERKDVSVDALYLAVPGGGGNGIAQVGSGLSRPMGETVEPAPATKPGLPIVGDIPMTGRLFGNEPARTPAPTEQPATPAPVIAWEATTNGNIVDDYRPGSNTQVPFLGGARDELVSEAGWKQGRQSEATFSGAVVEGEERYQRVDHFGDVDGDKDGRAITFNRIHQLGKLEGQQGQGGFSEADPAGLAGGEATRSYEIRSRLRKESDNTSSEWSMLTEESAAASGPRPTADPAPEDASGYLNHRESRSEDFESLQAGTLGKQVAGDDFKDINHAFERRRGEEGERQITRELAAKRKNNQDLGLSRKYDDTDSPEEENLGAPMDRPTNEAKKALKSRLEAPAEPAARPLPPPPPVDFNPFVDAAQDPMSTFSIDVDTASYTLARSYFDRNLLPPTHTVRTEEFLNFFEYNYAAPRDELFAVETELVPTPFNDGWTLRIGVKGAEPGRDRQRPLRLVIALDTSGSMKVPSRLDLVKASLNRLFDQLGPQDQVALVTYGEEATLSAGFTAGNAVEPLRERVNALSPTGSTHLENGVRLAYEVAGQGFDPAAMNRVLLISDGATNLGADTAEPILDAVSDHREQGIFLSVFGYGRTDYNDTLLEQLANKGDGEYRFIDSDDEIERTFGEGFSAAMHPIAADVKIQVVFDNQRVRSHRQIGYENRRLRHQDFRNDAVDAGEVGSGQTVTALYHLMLQEARPAQVATVYLRYRNLETGVVEERSFAAVLDPLNDAFEEASTNTRLAACVAAFAEKLRGNPLADSIDYHDIARALEPVARERSLDPHVQHLLATVRRADGLSRASN